MTKAATTTTLVTGGAGFIGHHVIRHLLASTDMDVVSLDRLDLSGCMSRLADVVAENPAWKKRLRVVWHDLKAPLNDLVARDVGPVEYVLHLAAGSHVDRSIDHPMEFVLDNVVGTCNLLDFARTKLSGSLKRFLYFSTDEVFGPAPNGVRYKENDRYNSGNPYSATKAGAEELCVAYENTYKLPIVVTHTMNVFGIRQHPEKFIPLVIKSARDGDKVLIHADATCTRAGSRFYVSANDVADAVLFLMKEARSGEKYNIVGAQETDNLQLAQMIASAVGKPLNYQLVAWSLANDRWLG